MNRPVSASLEVVTQTPLPEIERVGIIAFAITGYLKLRRNKVVGSSFEYYFEDRLNNLRSLLFFPLIRAISPLIRANLVAHLKTSIMPSPVRAEHSRYLTAPIFRETSKACEAGKPPG
jgi:hypothetical protein